MNWDTLLSLLSITQESLLVLVITAVTCAIIGSFLVLRKLSMVSDAISHSVLLGIVLAFFITRDISSPLLIVGAALFGVLTVFSIEMLSATGLVKNDDAVGIVFPLFFSLAVILITKYARNVHLDTDIVLMGEVIMAPLNRMQIGSLSLPKAEVQMGVLFVANLAFIKVFFKELKITTFDKEFATLAGFSSTLLFYALMTLSSLTAVVAFDAVGAILVVSFLIAPGASAYLVTKDLKRMLLFSCLYAVVNSLAGYFLALVFQVSMSGMTATVAGVTFFLTFLFHREGLLTVLIKRRRGKKQVYLDLMLLHIGNHSGTQAEAEEAGVETIKNHLKWEPRAVETRAQELIRQGLLARQKARYVLTDTGWERYDTLQKEYGM
ncbi:MAG: metal ABC transporter permease [Dialister sp.]|nr:metal ABC transporter permease [Dialister sp.]